MGITISNSQGLWLGFSLRSTSQHMWVMGVYIVWVRIECIRNDNLARQNISQVSCGKALLARHSWKPAVSILSWTFAFQLCAGHMHHFAGCLFASYPRKHFSLQFALSLHTHSLLHITLTNKSHMKYKVHKIEHNYNKIWHKIKANKMHSCKLQLYNLPLWLFYGKIPKIDSKLKHEFENSGKTHSHLI